MDITTARALLRAVAPNGDDTARYTDTKLDFAIQGIGDDFVQRTQSTRTLSTLSLAAGTSSLPSYPGGMALFRTEYILRAYITDAPVAPGSNGTAPPLSITSYIDVLNAITNGGQTGQPTLIGFDSNTTGAVYPITDAAYTLAILWDPPFTQWTAGTADAPTLATTLNIPAEYLRSILRWGGVYFLQGNEPELKTGLANAWSNYTEFVQRVMSRGVGTSGKQVSYRTPPGSRTRREITGMPGLPGNQ